VIPLDARGLLDEWSAAVAGDDPEQCGTCAACQRWRRARADIRAAAPALARDVLTLADALATAERERDEARETAVALGELAERQTRLIGRRMTFDDAMRAYARVIFDATPDAPNCVEWGGDINGRPYALSIQWLDGKSPQTLLAEAMADRDAMQRDRDTARAALDGLAGAAETARCVAACEHVASQCPVEDDRDLALTCAEAIAVDAPSADAIAATGGAR
jgi:hypothetical protein